MVAGSSASAARGLVGSFARYASHRIWVSLALGVTGSIVEAIGLIWLAAVLRVLMTAGAGPGATPWPMRVLFDLADTPEQRLALAFASFGLVVLVRAGLITWRDAYLARLQFGYAEHVRNQTLAALATARYQDVSRLSAGTLSQAITADINDLSIAANSMIQCGVASVTVLASAGLALLLSPTLALTAALLSIALFAVVPLARRATALGLQLRQRRRAVADRTLQLLAGLKPAKAQGIDRPLIDDIGRESAGVVETQLAFLGLQNRTRNLGAALAGAISIGCSVAGLLIWRIDPTVLVAFLLLWGRIAGPAIALHQGVHQTLESASGFVHLRRLRETLARKAGTETHQAWARQPCHGGLSFRNVSYLHRDGEGVAGVSLDIPEGAFWGVAGLSGAGKTTFVGLAAGLLQPQGGEVLRNGAPLSGRILDRHRAGLSYIEQDAVLFGRTLRDGFLLANPEADEAEIRGVLGLVGAEDLIRRLPGGLDSPLVTRDAFVSSGERQRLAIACALLRKPSILILDEATSALDLASEARVLTMLSHLAPRPLILLIAHRPQALAHCEHLLRFADGRLQGGSDGMIAHRAQERRHGL